MARMTNAPNYDFDALSTTMQQVFGPDFALDWQAIKSFVTHDGTLWTDNYQVHTQHTPPTLRFVGHGLFPHPNNHDVIALRDDILAIAEESCRAHGIELNPQAMMPSYIGHASHWNDKVDYSDIEHIVFNIPYLQQLAQAGVQIDIAPVLQRFRERNEELELSVQDIAQEFVARTGYTPWANAHARWGGEGKHLDPNRQHDEAGTLSVSDDLLFFILPLPTAHAIATQDALTAEFNQFIRDMKHPLCDGFKYDTVPFHPDGTSNAFFTIRATDIDELRLLAEKLWDKHGDRFLTLVQQSVHAASPYALAKCYTKAVDELVERAHPEMPEEERAALSETIPGYSGMSNARFHLERYTWRTFSRQPDGSLHPHQPIPSVGQMIATRNALPPRIAQSLQQVLTHIPTACGNPPALEVPSAGLRI